MLTRTVDHIRQSKQGQSAMPVPDPLVYDEVETALWTVYYPHMDPVGITVTAKDVFYFDPATEILRVEREGRNEVHHLSRAYFYTTKTYMQKVARKPYEPTVDTLTARKP